ncbi:MAG: tRNA (adenosine(37)-N6)-dimethylallyltransferase MiaA [Bacteroidia bacterium]|nr:tRNA (adenosine(37)-N6)-dimethylallyltransferase MiaA [Bacteroidia bacterium]
MEPQKTKKLIVLAGPTAVGKTDFAIKVANYFNTEIISCDSRQIYKELNIGVARPSQKELQEVKHHFIASHSIHDPYDAGLYNEEVNLLLKELFIKHDIVIMTGGTGLYIKAATEGLDNLPPKNDQLRQQLNFILETEGIDALRNIANTMEIDGNKVNLSNPQRIIRAIEIKQGKPDSMKEMPKNDFYSTSYYYLNRNRQELYSLINQRVDQMLKDGFEAEAKSLLPNRKLNALNTVGYKEFFTFFDGEMTKDVTVDKIKQHTRNYAKRQLTWFRNHGSYKEISNDVDLFLSIMKLG